MLKNILSALLPQTISVTLWNGRRSEKLFTCSELKIHWSQLLYARRKNERREAGEIKFQSFDTHKHPARESEFLLSSTAVHLSSHHNPCQLPTYLIISINKKIAANKLARCFCWLYLVVDNFHECRISLNSRLLFFCSQHGNSEFTQPLLKYPIATLHPRLVISAQEDKLFGI